MERNVVVLLYVDELIITGNDDNEVAKLQEELSIRFDMKRLVILLVLMSRTWKAEYLQRRKPMLKLVQRFGIKENDGMHNMFHMSQQFVICHLASHLVIPCRTTTK